MVLRLLVFSLPLVSSGIVVAGSSPETVPDAQKCSIPGDCLRHTIFGISGGWGTCTSRSAWRERFVHGTDDERDRMWKDRGKPMGERVLDAYSLSEGQRKKCNQVREGFLSDYQHHIGEKRNAEIRRKRARVLERIDEYIQAAQRVQDGVPGAAEAWAELAPMEEDPELLSLRAQLEEADREFPIDWSLLADRVEDALPPEQAKRGRQRLAERFPFSVSKRHGESLITGTAGKDAAALDARADAAALDRWQAYVTAFTKRYQPTHAQADATASVLQEVRTRAAQLAHTMQDEVARYQADGLEEEARRRREAYQLDLDDLFEGFKSRLHGLLTTAQQQRPPTTP